MAVVAVGLAGVTACLGKTRPRDIPSPLRSVATGWGHVDRATRERLKQPTGRYPAPLLQGGGYQHETEGYVVEQRVDMDLDVDGHAETIVAAQKWTEERGPEGYVMIFDGKTKALRYKTDLGWEVAALVTMTEGLPVRCLDPGDHAADPFVLAVGRGGFDHAGQSGATVEIIAWNDQRRAYERLLKVGGGEGWFPRWQFLEWGFPCDSLQVYGYLWDQSGLAIGADLRKGLVLVVYAWEPDKRRFTLILPKGP